VKLLVLAPFDPEELARLRAAGCEVVYESWIEQRRMYSPDDLAARLVADGFEGVVVEAEFVTRDVIEAVPRLRVIASARGKPVNVDLEAATELGRVVLQTPGRNAESVADLCLAMILDRARHVADAAAAVRRGEWTFGLDDQGLVPYIRFRGTELGGRTLGLVGFGAVARAVARRALAFGMTLLYVEDNDVPVDLSLQGQVRRVDFDTAVREADVISLHTPLTSETTHLVGEDVLRRMKPTAVLVNTSRGPVIDEAALVRALREGWIAAAGLDVYEREPAMAEGLAQCRTAVLAPHLGSATVKTRAAMARLCAENVLAALDGRVPPTCLNPQAWSAGPPPPLR
jgi:glyoxylate reductase